MWLGPHGSPVADAVIDATYVEVCRRAILQERYAGHGSAMKPSHEPIVVARKPLTGTVAANILAHGTGALNVDGCRIGTDWATDPTRRGWQGTRRPDDGFVPDSGGALPHAPRSHSPDTAPGRWPANVVLSHSASCQPIGTRRVRNRGGVPSGVSLKNSAPAFTSTDETSTVHHFDADGTEEVAAYRCAPDCPVRLLDEQAGEGSNSYRVNPSRSSESHCVVYGAFKAGYEYGERGYNDTGGASRFFPTFDARHEDAERRFLYCAKSSSAERNAGLDSFAAVECEGQSAWAGCCNVCGGRMMLNGKPTCGHDDFAWVTGKPTRNAHPTVKPVSLMRWLVRLVGGQPGEGVILDPFAGSGTTGVACALEGFDFIGIEQNAEYARIADARIAWWLQHPDGMTLVKRLELEKAQAAVAESGQASLFDAPADTAERRYGPTKDDPFLDAT